MNAFDPFNTGQPIALNVEISAWRCDREDRTCVFFCVSPKPTHAPEWAPMRTALASFHSAAASCERAEFCVHTNTTRTASRTATGRSASSAAACASGFR